MSVLISESPAQAWRFSAWFFGIESGGSRTTKTCRTGTQASVESSDHPRRAQR